MAISMTKVKNLLKREHPGTIVPHLRNIRINGNLRGCSGFLENTQTGKFVYICLEDRFYDPDGCAGMYRTATGLDDYTGGRNRWGRDLPSLLNEAVALTFSTTPVE